MVTEVQQQVIKIYTNRGKALLFTGGAGAFVAVDFLTYFGPTPEVTTQPWTYQEPFKTGLFIILLVVTGAALLGCLYRTVTPRPLVQLDAEGMVYEVYPFWRRSVSWADVSRISAFKDSYSVSPVQRSVRLTLWFTIKPHAVLTYGGKATFKWTITQMLLPIPLEKLVQSMQRYHHKVTLIDPHSLRRLAREHMSSEEGEQPAVSHRLDTERADEAMRPLSRHVTRIVVALTVGLLVGFFGVELLVYYVVGIHGGAFVLVNLLLSLGLGWLLISLLRRALLPHIGRREE